MKKDEDDLMAVYNNSILTIFPSTIYGGVFHMRISSPYTKDYAVALPRVDLNIPKQSLNFVGSQTGHSKSNMHSLRELTERR